MTNQVTFEAKTLAKAMKIIVGMVERRNTIPILGCVRIQSSKKDGCVLSCTDLDSYVSIKVDRMDYEGVIDLAVDAAVIFKIARASGVMPMRFEQKAEKITSYAGKQGKIEITKHTVMISVDGGAASYNLSAYNADDFPAFSGTDGVALATFPKGDFTSYLVKVKHCISSEETRYYLNGIHWEMGEKGSFFVATDGHKLAAYRNADEVKPAASMIIPRKLVRFLISHLSKSAITVSNMAYSCPAVKIETDDGITIRAKTIDGTFPDWRRVIPEETQYTFNLNKTEVLSSIAQVSAISSEKTRPIKFIKNDEKISVSCVSADNGDGKVHLQSVWPTGHEGFAANRDYFSAMIAGCNESFKISQNGNMYPLVIDDGDDRMTRILMPMRF